MLERAAGSARRPSRTPGGQLGRGPECLCPFGSSAAAKTCSRLALFRRSEGDASSSGRTPRADWPAAASVSSNGPQATAFARLGSEWAMARSRGLRAHFLAYRRAADLGRRSSIRRPRSCRGKKPHILAVPVDGINEGRSAEYLVGRARIVWPGVSRLVGPRCS